MAAGQQMEPVLMDQIHTIRFLIMVGKITDIPSD